MLERTPNIVEAMYQISRKPDFDGESKQLISTGCGLIDGVFGGVYIVEADPFSKNVRLLTWSLGGPEEKNQATFSGWLKKAAKPTKPEEDITRDHMVKAMLNQMSVLQADVKIVRGPVLGHACFDPDHEMYQQRVYEGIDEVTDIIVGYYPTSTPGRLIVMCIYRLNSKRRFTDQELRDFTKIVHKHHELYRCGYLGWSWHWWDLLNEREWKVWQLISTEKGMQNKAISRRLGLPGYTVGNIFRNLFKKFDVGCRGDLVQLFYNAPIDLSCIDPVRGSSLSKRN